MNTASLRSFENPWVDALDAVRRAGLMDGFTYSDLFDALHGNPGTPFLPGRFVALMHRFYGADGDAALSLHRRRTEGFAGVTVGESMNAWRWLARLVSAAPPLSGVILERGPHPSLYHHGQAEPFVAEDGWVSLADLVDAANVMLEPLSAARFVPLMPHPRGEGYLLLEPSRANALDRLGLLDRDWMESFLLHAPRLEVA